MSKPKIPGKLKVIDPAALDKRKASTRLLMEYFAEVEAALGGDMSPQERTVLLQVSQTNILIGNIWTRLMDEGLTIINTKGERVPHPLLAHWNTLTANVAQRLKELGMKRVAKKIPDAEAALRERYGKVASPAPEENPETVVIETTAPASDDDDPGDPPNS